MRKFAGSSLLEIKLKKLKQIKEIDEILVSSDSYKMLNIAKKFNLSTHKRKKYFASSKATNSEFFRNLAENINSGDYVCCIHQSQHLLISEKNNTKMQ